MRNGALGEPQTGRRARGPVLSRRPAKAASRERQRASQKDGRPLAAASAASVRSIRGALLFQSREAWDRATEVDPQRPSFSR